ncbi:MAG: metallophosphoesterase family protein [Candidatus Woesearchaeota archaeon]
MKILIIGCFHGKFPSKLKNIAKSCDFILSTGDFGGSEKLRKFEFKNFSKGYEKKLGKKKVREYYSEDYSHGNIIMGALDNLDVPVYTIDGNWDFKRTKRINKELGSHFKNYPDILRKTKNIKYLNKRIRKINGLNIYPHGGLMLASIFHTDKFFKGKHMIYKKWHVEQRKDLFRQKSNNLDIFLAHCPPFGYFDKVNYKGVNPMNGKHVGFKPYNEYIKKYHPKLFICGHMHEHQGIAKLGKTTILSHGPAQDGKAAILEINDKEKFKITLIR